MNTLKEKIAALNQLVLAGSSLEAFEKFYHNDVIMQENENPPTIGKDANRQREKEFFSKAKGFHENLQLHDVTVGDSVTMVRWSYNYQHDEWGPKRYTQVSVQHWKEGQIIKEQFFYGN